MAEDVDVAAPDVVHAADVHARDTSRPGAASPMLALQHAIGNRATRHLIQRHEGVHPGPNGHQESDHDASGNGPPFEPLVTIGTDPSAFVNGIGEVLDLVRTLRGDDEFQRNELDPSIFRPRGAYVFFEDYIVETDASGRIVDVTEQDTTNAAMIPQSVVLLREPGTTRLWSLGWVGDRFRANQYRTLGGRPQEHIPAGLTMVLSFVPGQLLGRERAESMRRRSQGRTGTAAEAEGWAREAADGAIRRRRDRHRREQRQRRERRAAEAEERTQGEESGTGTGVTGTGRGGGGEAEVGQGTGQTGEGTGRATDSTGSGRGRGGGPSTSDDPPLQGPEIIRLEVSPNGRSRLKISIGGATTRVNLRPGENERSLDRRVDQAVDRLQRSRDPSAQGAGIHGGVDDTGFDEDAEGSEFGGEVPEGERRGPGGVGGGEGEGGGTAAQDIEERVEGASSIANAPAYPSDITMAGYRRPEPQPGDPVPLNVAADVNAPTTVVGSTNAFTMALEYAARSFGTLDEVVNRLQRINFYWELIDVTNLNEEQARERSRSSRVGEGEYIDADHGTSADRQRTYEDIAADQEADLRMMREENWGWDARAAYLGVIGLSNSIRVIGSFVESYVSIVTTPANERSIGFADEGEYIVRCVATPVYDDETLENPDAHVVRASSVAALPVRVQNIQARADEAMGAEERNLERLRALVEHAESEEERERYRLQLAAAERGMRFSGHGAFTSTLEGLRSQLALAQRLKAQQDAEVPEGNWETDEIQLALYLAAKRQTVDALVRQVTAQIVAYGGSGADTGTGEHEEWVAEQSGGFRGREFRPRIVLASRENGQVTPVLAMLGELPRENDEDTRPRWRLVDISSPGARDYYEGRGGAATEAGHQEAIRQAFQKFAEENEYGRGIIAIRLPDALLQQYGTGISMPSQMVSAPGNTDRALQRLQDLATAAEIAGLFLTGGAGLALGAVGAVAGLAASIDSLARRSRTGHMLEVGTLFDIMGIVGSVAFAGGLGVVRARSTLDDFVLASGQRPSWAGRVELAEGVMKIHGVIDNIQQVIAIPHQVFSELEGLADVEPEGERRKRVALAMLHAVRSGSIQFIQSTGGFVAEHGPPARGDITEGAPTSGVDVDTGAARAHADGNGPAIPPRTPDVPTPTDTEQATRADGETVRRVRAPSDGDVIAAAEALGRRRVQEAGSAMYGNGDGHHTGGDQASGREGPDAGSTPPALQDRPSVRPGGPAPPAHNRALADLTRGSGADTPAEQARRAIHESADLGAIRRQFELTDGMSDDQRAAAGRELQAARVEITDEHVARVLEGLQERFPQLAISVVDLGTQGLQSDRDVTVRAEPSDPAAYAAMSEAERAAVDRAMVQASAEAVPLLYESLEAAGLSPDRALDTNFYTELHEGRLRPANQEEHQAIIADQQVVSLTEVLLNTSEQQFQSYVDGQLAMLDGQRGTPERMRQAMRDRFLAQVEAARSSARRLLGAMPGDIDPGDHAGRRDRALGDARQRLVDALNREPPASPRELRQLMADIKLLEPDAYGTRSAVEGVVLGGQAMRRADLPTVLDDGFRTQADIDAGVGERGPLRFDPVSRQMVELSAEQEVERRRSTAGQHVGHRRPGDTDASAFEVNAPRLAAAEAVLGHLLAHVPESGAAPTAASTAAKNLGRIASLAEESGIRRARRGGLSHLAEIVAAKQANPPGPAIQAALRGWASDGAVAAWARTEGMPIGSDLQRLRAFIAWTQSKAHGLIGQMRQRTESAAYAGDVDVGTSHTPHSGPDGSEGPPAPAARRRGGDDRSDDPSSDVVDDDTPTVEVPAIDGTPSDSADDRVATREPHVGDDGIVDLDDPRNAWLTDGMIGSLPSEMAGDEAASRQFFQQFIDAHPGLESAMVQNTLTGEFLIVQGNEQQVDTARIADAVDDLRPGAGRRGRWFFVAHSHVVDAAGATPHHLRIPSIGDIHGVAVEADMRGRAVSEEIRIRLDPDTPATVLFGFDPGAALPITIELPRPEGTSEVLRFPDIEAYQAWASQHVGSSSGEVPEHSPASRSQPSGPPRRTSSGDVIDDGGWVQDERTDRTYARREFFAEDAASDDPDQPHSPRYQAAAQLSDDGTMSMDFGLRERLADQEMHRSGSLRGFDEFGDALQHFRDRLGADAVRRIKGEWGLGDNLDAFMGRHQELVDLGVDDASARLIAASETTTGQWADRVGFGRIADVQIEEGTITAMFEPGASNAPPTPVAQGGSVATGSSSAGRRETTSTALGPDTQVDIPIPDFDDAPTQPDIVLPDRERDTLPEFQLPETAATETPTARPRVESTPQQPAVPIEVHLPGVHEALRAAFESDTVGIPLELPSADTFVVAPSWFDYYETWRQHDPDRRQGELPEGPAYFHQGKVYLPPGSDQATIAHETLHVVTNEQFGQRLPLWINEGVTEMFTQTAMGEPSANTGYVDNITIAELIRDRVGDDVLRRAYFEGDIAGLDAALAPFTGTDDTCERLRTLFDALGIRGTSTIPPDVLAQIRAMLGDTAAGGGQP